MKKTKLLIPTLSIVGLATAVAPMVTMTSCGSKGESKSDWTTITIAEFQAKMNSSYGEFNKETNLNSFAPSDLTVKYNGEQTTSFSISNTAKYDGEYKQFVSKNIELVYYSPVSQKTTLFNSTKNEPPRVELFYPKSKMDQLLDPSVLLEIKAASKKGDNYKLHFKKVDAEREETTEYIYIFNSKGYVTHCCENLVEGEETIENKFDIEYKVDPYEVSNYTFVTDEDDDYVDNLCILQNNKTYTFNVKSSKEKLSKFRISYYDYEQETDVYVDLSAITTIKVGSMDKVAQYKDDHLEFEEVPADNDITITLNLNTLPSKYHYFRAEIYNE